MKDPGALADRTLAGVTAAILAGGLGTRLRPVLADRPKVLAEVRGRPFLAYLLDQLVAVNLRYVVLCTGYLGEQVKATFGDSYGQLRLVYSQESSPLGTAGALRLALPLLKSDPVLVMNGDSFYNVNLQAFWVYHGACKASATLALVRVSDPSRYGQVRVDTHGAVISFQEKGSESNPGWISAGVYLLTRAFLLRIPTRRVVSLEREVFPAWIGRGLYAYPGEGRFLDIGTPEAYASTEQFFAPETRI